MERKWLRRANLKISAGYAKALAKSHFTIGFLFSFLFVIVVFRRFFLFPGIAEYADIDLPYYRQNLLAVFNAWNKFASGDTAYLLYMYILSWVAIPFSASGTAFERILYFLMFFSASYFMFLVVYDLIKKIGADRLPCYIAAGAASIIYILNPNFYTKIASGAHGLVSYSLTPLVFYFSRKVVGAKTLRGMLRYSLILAILQALSFAIPFTFVPNFLFMCLIISLEAVWAVKFGKENRLRVILSGTTGVAVAFSFSVLMMSFVLLPFFSVRRSFSFGPWGNYYAHLIFDVPLADAIRIRPSTNNPLSWQFSTFTAALGWDLSTFVVPLLSLIITPVILIFVWKVHRREHLASPMSLVTSVYSIFIVVFISVFLAKARNPPFGELYSYLASHLPFGWLLRYPEVWLIYTTFSYAVLCGILVGLCHHYRIQVHLRVSLRGVKRLPKSIKVPLSVVFLIAVILGSSFASFLMLTGDAGGMLSPAEPPQGYKDANQWLLERSDWFRVFWMQGWSLPPWMPSAHPIGNWFSPLPIAQAWSPTQGNFVNFAQLFAPSLSDAAMGKTLGLFGVKYILLYKDEPTSYGELSALLENQDNVKKVYENSDIVIFENEDYTPYLRGLSARNIILVYGSLDSMFSTNITDFSPENYAMVFPEQQMSLANFFLNDFSGGNVLIYNKHFTDLLFSTLEDAFFLIPQNYINYVKGNERWWVNSESDNNLVFSAHDKTYDKGHVVGNGAFIMPFSVNASRDYELWVRVPAYLQSFVVYVDGERIGSVEISEEFVRAYSPTHAWLKVSTLDLETGKHELKMESSSSLVRVNLFALIHPETFVEKQKSLFRAFEDTNKTITYMYDRGYINSIVPQISVPIYTDNFTAYPIGKLNSSLWNVVDGNWSIQQLEDRLALTQGTSENYSSNAMLRDVTISDSVIELDVKYIWQPPNTDGHAFNVLVRYRDDSHYYQFNYNHMFNAIQIWKQSGNQTYRLADSNAVGNPIRLEPGQWYKLKIELLGNELKFYVNGTKYLDTVDNTPDSIYTRGSFGLGTSDCITLFSNLSIQSISQRFPVIAPRSSEYILAFLPATQNSTEVHNFSENTLMIDETILTLVGELDASHWIYARPIWLEPGYHNITIISGPDIKKIALYSAGGTNLTLTDMFGKRNSSILFKYEEVDPTKYIMKLNLSEPVILVHSEARNDLWKARINGEEFQSFPLYTQINGFYINKTGALTLTIEYDPQKYFLVGKNVSLVATLSIVSFLFADLLILFMRKFIKKRKNQYF